MSFNLTNEFIDQTFQQLVQISGSNLVDGTGSVITSADITVQNAASASYVEFSNVDNVPNFLLESEFDTFTGSFDAFSGSVSTEIVQLQQFSSSLDATFATDAELSALSGSLTTTINGIDTRVDTLENKTLVSGSSQIILQDTLGNLSGSRVDGAVTTSNTASYVEFSNVDNVPDFLLESEFNSFTGSFNTFSGSVSTEITELQQFSSSLDATFATDAELSAVSSSLDASISLVSTDLNTVSGSLSGRVTNLEAFSSSLDATFATDAELSAVSSSLSGSIATVSDSLTILSGSVSGEITGLDTRVDTIESKTLVSGSIQVTLQDTLGNLSGSRIEGEVASALSASFAVTASFALNSVTTDSFKTIAVAGQSDVVADTPTDTLTLVAGTNVTITTDAGTDSITIDASAGSAFPFTGSAVITGSLEVIGAVTGSFFTGDGSGITNIISSSHALNADNAITASFVIGAATTGSNIFDGNQIITGSVNGNVIALSISSNTASIDFSTGNFFTLTLASGSDTHIASTGVGSGQTVSMLVTQDTATGSISFDSIFKFSSGSLYEANSVTGSEDILTFITFASTSSVYVNSVTTLE